MLVQIFPSYVFTDNLGKQPPGAVCCSGTEIICCLVLPHGREGASFITAAPCLTSHLHAFVFSISLGCCLIFRAVIFHCAKCLLEQGWEVPALFCSVTQQVKRKQCPCFSFQREVNKQMVNG